MYLCKWDRTPVVSHYQKVTQESHVLYYVTAIRWYHTHTRGVYPRVYTHLPCVMCEHLVIWNWILITMCIDECRVYAQRVDVFDANRTIGCKTPVWLQNACFVAKRLFRCKTHNWVQNACFVAKHLFSCKMHNCLQNLHDTSSCYLKYPIDQPSHP